MSPSPSSASVQERAPLLPKAPDTAAIDVEVAIRADKQDGEHAAPVSVLRELSELLALAYPVLLTTALEFLPGFTSTVLAGHIDSPLKKEYVDAATMSTMFTNITAYSIGFGLTSALDTLCSQAYGAKRFDKIGVYAQAGVLVLGACLAPIALVNWHMAPVLSWFGQDAVVSELAQVYSRYNLIGIPFVFLYDVLRRAMQAQNVMAPLVAIAVASNVLQIAAGYWLAYRTSWGFAGIALSRSLGNMALPLLVGLYLRARPAFLRQWWAGWDLSAALEHVGLFLRLGVPGMLMLVMEWWAFELLSLMAGVLPDSILAVSAHAVQMSVVSLVYMVFLGLSVATNIRVGNHLGANEPERARVTATLGFGVVGVVGALLAAAVFVWRHAISALFVDDAETIAMAGHVLLVWAPFEVSEALNCVVQGVFRGVGKQNTAARTNAITYYGVGVPLAYVLAFRLGWGVEGLWVGLGLGVTASFLSLWLVLRRWSWVELARDAEHRTAE
ncbi:hypothetical protein P43SY_001186 [Pythium insidiosum]|uniref:Multidrug/Oligosaccharidyl-lipid/Polysaccharide (MOP) Flippase Superfamily n=1 Tax=Pythium insidiosum TaxID=114742 RepID=A0AAD5LYP3_PYTIN|nr:hypothetical protein P43SY_001186 [Pythium insidiosum]